MNINDLFLGLHQFKLLLRAKLLEVNTMSNPGFNNLDTYPLYRNLHFRPAFALIKYMQALNRACTKFEASVFFGRPNYRLATENQIIDEALSITKNWSNNQQDQIEVFFRSKNWIDQNMALADCVIVLIGQQTATKKFVRYEIKNAVETGKPIFGIYIHRINSMRTGSSEKGKNPFEQLTITKNGVEYKLSELVPAYNPNMFDAYGDICKNLTTWINEARAI